MNNGKEYLSSKENDIRYRQGRSYDQREGHYKFFEYLIYIMMICVFSFFMFTLFKSIIL